MSTFNSPTDAVALGRVKSADINNLDAATGAAFALLPDETRLKQGTVQYAVDSGVVNAYVVAMPQTATSYADGMLVSFQPRFSNTGAATINVDSLGVKSIRQYNGAVLNASDIVLGVPTDLRYSVSTGFFHRVGSGPAGATGATGPTGSISAAPSGTFANPGMAFASETTTGATLISAGYYGVGVQGSAAMSLIAASRNAFFGVLAGPTAITCIDNTLIGAQAGTAMGNGSANTAVGSLAFVTNATGSENTATGYKALNLTLNVSGNSAYGSRSLSANTTGQGNTAVGNFSGDTTTAANANTLGSFNTWMGFDCGPGVVSATSLQNTTAIGNGARSLIDNQVVLGNAAVTSIVGGSNGVPTLGTTAKSWKGLYADYTITAVVGNVTINKMAGNAIMASGASSVVVTNNRVTANSIVMVVPVGPALGNLVPHVTPAAGTFTILVPGSYGANQEFRWFLINTD